MEWNRFDSAWLLAARTLHLKRLGVSLSLENAHRRYKDILILSSTGIR
jgi:hypothetical protein